MTTLPACQTLLLEPHNGVLHITLNRPESRSPTAHREAETAKAHRG